MIVLSNTHLVQVAAIAHHSRVIELDTNDQPAILSGTVKRLGAGSNQIYVLKMKHKIVVKGTQCPYSFTTGAIQLMGDTEEKAYLVPHAPFATYSVTLSCSMAGPVIETMRKVSGGQVGIPLQG